MTLVSHIPKKNKAVILLSICITLPKSMKKQENLKLTYIIIQLGIGHTLRKDKSSVARQATQWNPLDGIGRKKGRPCETSRRTVERECKNLNKTWPDLKQLAQSRVRWRVGIVDALCPGRGQGN